VEKHFLVPHIPRTRTRGKINCSCKPWRDARFSGSCHPVFGFVIALINFRFQVRGLRFLASLHVPKTLSHRSFLFVSVFFLKFSRLVLGVFAASPKITVKKQERIPASLRDELRRTVALKCLSGIFGREGMGLPEQHTYLEEHFHGQKERA
jgi:hypothetical protein